MVASPMLGAAEDKKKKKGQGKGGKGAWPPLRLREEKRRERKGVKGRRTIELSWLASR